MTNKEQLLADVEDALRNIPAEAVIQDGSAESLSWLGKASAAIEGWNSAKTPTVSGCRDRILRMTPWAAGKARMELIVLLHQASNSLRTEIPGAGTAVAAGGMVFTYFDEIRKVIELAAGDLLFVDPYLDAEFVSRYLPHVKAGVTVRLLARERLKTLLPAAELFAQQQGTTIKIRSAARFHDRYILVDGTGCYQSGASFKDGARSAPTTLTQIMDAFDGVRKIYEDIWATAKVER